MNREELNVFIIPPNFTDGIIIADRVISLHCFFQGLIIAGIPAAIVFKLYDPGSLTVRISVCISAFLPVFIFSAAGIQGNGVIDFLMIILRFRKNRRKCFYNPRIKQEEQFVFPFRQSAGVINGRRIVDFLKDNSSSKKTDSNTDENLFFEEDGKFIETPVEYMNLSQYFQYLLKKRRSGKKEVKIYED